MQGHGQRGSVLNTPQRGQAQACHAPALTVVSRGRISIVTVNRELYRIADIGMQLFVARCNTPGTLNHTRTSRRCGCRERRDSRRSSAPRDAIATHRPRCPHTTSSGAWLRHAQPRNLERRHRRAGNRPRRRRPHRARARRPHELGADARGDRGHRRDPAGRTALVRQRRNAQARTVRNAQLRTQDRDDGRVDRARVDNGRGRRRGHPGIQIRHRPRYSGERRGSSTMVSWKAGAGTPSKLADPPRPGIGTSSTTSSSAISSNSMTGAGPEAPAYTISRRCRSSEVRTGRVGSDGPRRLLNGRQGKMDRAETQGRRSESPTGDRGSPTEREHVPSSHGGRRVHRIAFHPGHPGVDPLALCRAAWRTYGCGRREGGSTVAMQLVRVLTGRFERSWRRKADEIVLAMLVTRHVPSDELLALYLSVGYYGSGMNGFVQACRRLGIDPVSCSLQEAASMIARLKYPEPRICTAGRRLQIAQRSEYLMARLKEHGRQN